MKKNYLPFLLLIVLRFSNITAQDCLPGVGIVFATQGQIDSFPINYPGCSQVLGNMVIQESVDGTITNLDSLSQINSIGGALRVSDNDALMSLEGLNNLTSVGESLSVYSNDAMTSFTGLENLVSIGGRLSVGRFFPMGGVRGNPVLNSLSALENLTSIGDDLFVVGNPVLMNMGGLENVTSINGLHVSHNNSLTNLAELENLVSIAGNLRVTNNNALISLEGLGNIDPTTITWLELTGSSNLAICEVKSICDYLAVPTNPATISDNSSGCNNREEVEGVCDEVVGVNQINAIEVQIYPNPC